MLQNLIENALKYSREGIRPVINISAAPCPDYWVIAVRDNGIGIPDKYHSDVFRAFKRAPDTKDKQGIGLGLATCKKIVQQHGGRIWVESEIGKGSTFYFTCSKT
jgi:signal transduction histidine kinase